MASTEEVLFQKFGRAFPAGTVLFREGEQGHEMYVVHAGQVRITKDVRGHQKVLADIGVGEFFGEMSILNEKPRSATATVVDDAKLLVLSPKTFEAMIKHSTEIALRMVKRLAARLQEADDHIENLMLRDPQSRVVHLLIRMAKSHGDDLPLAAEELPGELGLNLAQVKAALAAVEKKGLIDTRDDGIRIPDRNKLEQFLEFLEMREQFGDD